MGLKFRRQHPVCGFVVDFACLEHRLVIEVDGGYHDEPEQRRRDAERTAVLESYGYTVVRIRNRDVSPDGLEAIVIEAIRRPHHDVPPLRRAERGPGGEAGGQGADVDSISPSE